MASVAEEPRLICCCCDHCEKHCGCSEDVHTFGKPNGCRGQFIPRLETEDDWDGCSLCREEGR